MSTLLPSVLESRVIAMDEAGIRSVRVAQDAPSEFLARLWTSPAVQAGI